MTLADGLVASWSLNDTLTDPISGQTLVSIDGASYFETGKLGKAWGVGGVATRGLKTLTPPMDSTPAFTVSVWHRFTRTVTPTTNLTAFLFDLRNTSNGRHVTASLGLSPGYWWIEMISYTGYIAWEPTAFPFDNNWHNWLFIYANGLNAAKIYLDGVLKKSGSVTPQAIAANRLNVGVMTNGAGGIYPADSIDGFHWWNRALSAPEVAQVYNSGTGWEYTPPDSTPNAFEFADVVDADPETSYTSNSQTVTGMDAGTSISISGGEYRINGGAWTSGAGTIDPGQTLELRATSSAESEGVVTVTVTVGTASADWTITTGVLSSIVSNLVGSSILGSRILRSRIVQGHV